MFQPVAFGDLNSRQKENWNFQKGADGAWRIPPRPRSTLGPRLRVFDRWIR